MLLREYPKLLSLLAVTTGAYGLYLTGAFTFLHRISDTEAYAAVFLGGALFSFGFTAPFGIGVLLEIGHNVHPVIGGVLGGLGALLVDLFIFRVMRFEFFHDEIHRLRTTRFVTWTHRMIHHEKISEKLRTYLLWSFAGIVIASPLPDEFGVILVSSFSNIKSRTFALVCFSCNLSGITLLLVGSRALA